MYARAIFTALVPITLIGSIFLINRTPEPDDVAVNSTEKNESSIELDNESLSPFALKKPEPTITPEEETIFLLEELFSKVALIEPKPAQTKTPSATTTITAPKPAKPLRVRLHGTVHDLSDTNPTATVEELFAGVSIETPTHLAYHTPAEVQTCFLKALNSVNEGHDPVSVRENSVNLTMNNLTPPYERARTIIFSRDDSDSNNNVGRTLVMFNTSAIAEPEQRDDFRIINYDVILIMDATEGAVVASDTPNFSSEEQAVAFQEIKDITIGAYNTFSDCLSLSSQYGVKLEP